MATKSRGLQPRAGRKPRNGAVSSPKTSILLNVGSQIRLMRDGRRWTRRRLAAETGLSERFLAQVESGRGNPSVLSLVHIATALGTTPSDLLVDDRRGSVVALLGLRGAGKSTVGRALAEASGVSFVELDQRVEEAAGLSLSEIFELHGEAYYERFERQALEEILARRDAIVLATGGGIVMHDGAFALLKQSATTVWLRATPEDHWSRVVQQGDHRP